MPQNLDKAAREAAGAPSEEIEITPAMINAGVEEFFAFDSRYESASDAV